MSVETPELRAEKYNTEELNALKAKGHTFPGTTSYPIDDADDLDKAIKAVGRGGADHDAIRKYIIGRAKALGLSKEIPDNWNADGSLQEQNSSAAPVETRADDDDGTKTCPTCDGDGTIMEGNRKCPDCDGTGKVPDESRAARPSVARRKKERHRAIPLIPEVRVYATEGLEIREADTAGNLVTITGAPIIYDKWYPVVDRRGEFQERMLPGVAKDVIAGDTRFLFNHDGLPLARTMSGTLALDDTPAKLQIGATVDIRQHLANDLVIAVERGDVTDMSVGFLADQDKWNATRDERSVHHFKSMPDVSAVTYPASPTTHLEIAQRMAQAAGVEPGARIRRLYADYRAGQVLSAQNKGVVIDAVKALHGVLQSAGFDPADLIEGEEPGDGVEDVGPTDGGPMGASDDGAIGGNALPAGDGAGPDARAVFDPGESMRANVPATRAERRAAIESPSYDDQRQKVCGALSDYLSDMGASTDVWICDLGEDWVVYETWPDSGQSLGQFKLSYAQTADGVTFDGAPVRVNSHTEWVPAQERDASILSELRAQYRVREYRQRTAA